MVRLFFLRREEQFENKMASLVDFIFQAPVALGVGGYTMIHRPGAIEVASHARPLPQELVRALEV